MNGASLKENVVDHATISCNLKIYKPNYTKEVAKQILRSATVTVKNHLTCHCTNKIPSYQRSTGT